MSDAFKNAEVSPSENSWNNIALELEKANGQQMKKKLLFYQMLAAASVIFAMGISFGMYVLNERNAGLATQLAAIQQNINDTPAESENPSANRIAENSQNSIEKDAVEAGDEKQSANPRVPGRERTETSNARKEIAVDNDRSLTSAKNGTNKFQTSSTDEGADNPIIQNGENKNSSVLLANRQLPELYHLSQPQLLYVKKEENVDHVALMMARLNDLEKELSGKAEKEKEDEKRSETLWTSVGFAAGTFSCSTSSGVSTTRTPNAYIADNSNIADKEATASGIAYSVGVSLGKKLSERWVLQGGINYLNQSSDYTAHNAVSSPDFTSFRPASIHELAKLNVSTDAFPNSEEKLVTTAPYDVNNSMRYLSIPIQAGYLVVNKAFGVQINAGVATDVFLQSTVTAEGKVIDDSTQETGDDSPYRPVNFSGLMGTELSYRFAKHYRIALNPGIRYSLNTIYKSDLGVETEPITFDLGLRFRYIFN